MFSTCDPQLLDARFDVRLLARALDDGGAVLVDRDALGAAEIRQRHGLELQAQLLVDRAPAGEGGDVREHLLAVVAEPGRLHRADLQRAAQLVDHQRRQRVAVDVLGDDEQRLARLCHLLENGQQILQGRELPLVQEDEAVVEHRLQARGVGHEVGRQVPAIELHALDHVEGGLHRLGLLDRDHALLAHLLHRLRQDVADDGLAVGADRRDLGDFSLASGGLGLRLQAIDDRANGRGDAAPDVHRVVARGDQLAPFAVDGLREHGRGGGAVTGHVGGLGRHLLHHLRAHVGEPVFELDLLGDRHPVLGHGGRAPAPLENHVPTARAERHLDGVREHVEAVGDALSGRLRKNHLFGCHARDLQRRDRGRQSSCRLFGSLSVSCR